MKKQIVIIHGGDTFENQESYIDFLNNFQIDIERYKLNKVDWKFNLQSKLGAEYEVISPAMPSKNNAKYNEWKIWFDKIIPFLYNGVILIGHSLGASFLAKYLSENKMPIEIGGVFLVSGVFDKDFDGYSLATFSLPEKIDLQTKNIYLYHSKDDPVVPFSAFENFAKTFPNAKLRALDGRGHINQEDFLELERDIVEM